jgi:ureidoglycolate lyase
MRENNGLSAPVGQVVRAEPLTAAAFAPFGQVVCAGGPDAGKAANQGTAVRFDWAAALESTRAEARPNLAVFRAVARPLPLAIHLLERHPCSTQAFLPLVCSRFLVCVAPAAEDGTPDVSGLRAFVAVPGQGINYGRGVWHHPIVALDHAAEFAMLAWEAGTPEDCVEHWFGAPIGVSVD